MDNHANDFCRLFTGHFSNKTQALKNPREFAHIDIYVRQLPYSIFNSLGFYSEQSFNHAPWSPYRQAVQELYIEKNKIILKSYKLENSIRVAGGGFKPELLDLIKKEYLTVRPGCEMKFAKKKENCYKGKLLKSKKCIINRDCNLTYLVSNVEIDEKGWRSLDEGFDVKTNKKIWGSINGNSNFKRVFDT